MHLSEKQIHGRHYEAQACAYLTSKGMQVIAKNYTCYFGEIDLIMQDKEQIVFVEVRSRTNNHRFGNAIETVTADKMSRLRRTAVHFLQSRRWVYKKISRFDIIAIHSRKDKPEINWVKNAFTVDS